MFISFSGFPWQMLAISSSPLLDIQKTTFIRIYCPHTNKSCSFLMPIEPSGNLKISRKLLWEMHRPMWFTWVFFILHDVRWATEIIFLLTFHLPLKSSDQACTWHRWRKPVPLYTSNESDFFIAYNWMLTIWVNTTRLIESIEFIAVLQLLQINIKNSLKLIWLQ